MKESRYIELLNLYLDHQLTPQESAELEAEVLRNPERRRIYNEYCRMQKACAMLFDTDRALAPKTAAAVTALNAPQIETASFPGWLGFGGRGLAMAGLAAAAACAAFVVVKVIPQGGAGNLSSTQMAATSVEPASEANSDNPDSVVSRRSDFQAVFIANSSLRTARAFEWESASAQDASAGLEWLKHVSLPTVRAPKPEDLRFEPVSLKQTEQRAYGSRRPFEGQVEMSAFQFQR